MGVPDRVYRHGAPVRGYSLYHDEYTDWTDDLWLTAGSNMLWALDKNNRTIIWMWDDTLATPVIGLTPTAERKLVTTSSATLTWRRWMVLAKYELALYSYCPACPDQKQALTPI